MQMTPNVESLSHAWGMKGNSASAVTRHGMPTNHLPPHVNETEKLAGRYGVFTLEVVETTETLGLRPSLQSNIMAVWAMN